MFYAELKEKPEGLFKRLTGVRPATFLDICAALENICLRADALPNFACKTGSC